jgi:segregation and condensation protein B
MTEQHTRPTDNSEAFSVSAVATTAASTSEPESEVELGDAVASPIASEPIGESNTANSTDEAVSGLKPDAPDPPEDEHSDSSDSGASAEALPALIEALLFVVDQPIDANALARALKVPPLRVRRALDQLAESLRDPARGVRLQVGPEGAQLATAPETATAVEHFLGLEASRRLSNAALETLAIIAYRQPVTRHIIDQIRGVDSGGALATLRARNLIEAVGRAPGPGRPVLFTTTQRFLEHFGLERRQDLPMLPEDLELPPEDAGAQLALDQAISTELNANEDPEQPDVQTPAADPDSPESTGDSLDQNDLDKTVLDVNDDDVKISSDLDDLSRAAGAAFSANEQSDSSGD